MRRGVYDRCDSNPMMEHDRGRSPLSPPAGGWAGMHHDASGHHKHVTSATGSTSGRVSVRSTPPSEHESRNAQRYSPLANRRLRRSSPCSSGPSRAPIRNPCMLRRRPHRIGSVGKSGWWPRTRSIPGSTPIRSSCNPLPPRPSSRSCTARMTCSVLRSELHSDTGKRRCPGPTRKARGSAAHRPRRIWPRTFPRRRPLPRQTDCCCCYCTRSMPMPRPIVREST